MSKKSGRKGPGRQKASPAAIETAQRHAQWIQDRLARLTYRQIAARDGVSRTTVHEGVTRALARVTAEPAEKLKQRELDALEELIEMAMEAFCEGELDRVEQLRKLLADRRKLLGLDAPTKVEAKVSGEAVDIDELRALLRPLGWDVVPLAIDTTGESHE